MGNKKLKNALKTLGISRYEQRILNCNNNGDNFHLSQYFKLADVIGETGWFSDWFDETVRLAEDSWQNPENVFLHINKILLNNIK